MNDQELIRVPVTTRASITHLGSLDSFDITSGGKKAAGLILKYLNGDRTQTAPLKRAISLYDKLIPNENFGGEYTALQWLCRLWTIPDNAREDLLRQPMVNAFYELLSANDYADLKMYLNLKYHFREREKDDIAAKDRLRFLEDFILFNNPDRERWEKTRQNMEQFKIQPGDRVADVGSGSGYFTFKFADIVGEQGRVYAIETNPLHLDFLNNYVKQYDVNNVEIVTSSFSGIGLDPETKVDVVFMCSLYHNVYSAFTDYERDQFVGSIRNALRDGGRLIIVDNDLVPEDDIPYHGPYICKDLVRAQLWYYGFRMTESYQFTPQRYVLVFDKVDIPEPLGRTTLNPEMNELTIGSSSAIIRYRIIGTATSGYSIPGKRIGQKMYDAMLAGDKEGLRAAREEFGVLWPRERIGDDYTALMWFCDWLCADEAEKKRMQADPLADSWCRFFTDNDCERLKKYLYAKFDLAVPIAPDADEHLNYEYSGNGEITIPTLNEWNEYLIFNNQNRVLWENTEELLRALNIQPGEHVADIGCGGGYFSWQFSKLAGETGKVYATEINKDALNYLDGFIKDYGVKNIETVVTRMNDAGLLADSVDTIFMCSMYHAVYITNIEFVKDHFIDTVKKALRKNGRVIVVDNDIPDPGIPSYYGPGIIPEMIISQLHYYGFELEDRIQLIPQRFALVFRMKDKTVTKQKLKPKIKFMARITGEKLKRKPMKPQ